MSDYDEEVEKIRAYNQPILDGFQDWLENAGLAPETVNSHVENIDFFAEYLVYYEPLRKLDDADATAVYSFLADWFPRKAMWASESSMRSNMASFRKFFQFLRVSGRIHEDIEGQVRETLKESKDEFLDGVASDDGYS